MPLGQSRFSDAVDKTMFDMLWESMEKDAEAQAEAAEQAARVEAAGAPAPTVMSKKDRRLWDDIFKLMALNRRFVDFLDVQASKPSPPAFLYEPWSVGDIPRWPDYKTLRSDYQSAGAELIQVYNLQTGGDEAVSGLGLAIPVIALGIFAMATAAFITWQVKEIKKPEAVKVAEAQTEYMIEVRETFGDEATRKKMLEKALELLNRVSKAAGIELPPTLKPPMNILMVGAALAGGYLMYRLMKK